MRQRANGIPARRLRERATVGRDGRPMARRATQSRKSVRLTGPASGARRPAPFRLWAVRGTAGTAKAKRLAARLPTGAGDKMRGASARVPPGSPPTDPTDPEGAASKNHKMEPSASPSRLSLFCVIRIRGWSLAALGERRRRERESQERENWEGERIGGS